ncbi:type IV pilus assembly protein PilM [Patescibacteria group bacterium]|nr:type IV pilus assembly protein PilM [Patescibacteria group bacterium]
MKSESFLKFFPPPRYLRAPAVGIDVSDRSLKYVELKNNKGNFSVFRYGTRVMPENIIESGEIKDRAKFTDILKSLNKELGVKFVNVSLPEEKAFVSRIEMPFMELEDLRGAIELQIEEHIPLAPEDIIFDFEIIGRDEKKKIFIINLAACPRNLVEIYRDCFKDAGFLPLVFEMETHAFARAMVSRKDENFYFLVDFGKTRTSFAIVGKNKVQFTSTVKIGGDDLNSAIMKNFNIDLAEAEEIKKKKGMVRGKDNERVFNILLSAVSVIKDEIKKHVNYWNIYSGEKMGEQNFIKKILLCGGDSNLIGFPEYISYELKIPAELCNPWINIVDFEDHVPEIDLRESLIYVVALGLALRSFIEE